MRPEKDFFERIHSVIDSTNGNIITIKPDKIKVGEMVEEALVRHIMESYLEFKEHT